MEMSVVESRATAIQLAPNGAGPVRQSVQVFNENVACVDIHSGIALETKMNITFN